MKVTLFAPAEYWEMSEAEREVLANGCGPKNWKIDLVPDSPLGFKFHKACDIHDYMYSAGKTIQDKESADRAFLNNMFRIVDASSKTMGELLEGRTLAYVYYEAVKKFGGCAFWEGKNLPEELKEVDIEEPSNG